MLRTAFTILGLVAAVAPAVARAQAYDYPPPERGYSEPSGAYDAQAGSYDPQSAAYDAQAGVDVSVDLATPGAAVSFDTFHDALAPYGEWVTVAGYGRVWRPLRVAAGWRPYYYGRWEWTDEGWLWVSDEPWGWGPYHYGRWTYDGSYGWVWVPGYEWAPAWVTWRFSGDVIGWAPLLPGFSVFVANYPAIYTYWTFVPCARFVGTPVYSIAYAPAYLPRLYHGTAPAPPRASHFGAPAPAWGGPPRPFVEQRVGHAILPARVVPVPSPAHAAAPPRPGVVPIYRPEVRPGPAPADRGHAGAPPPVVGGGRGGAPGSPSGGGGWRSGPGGAPHAGGASGYGQAAPRQRPGWGPPAPVPQRGYRGDGFGPPQHSGGYAPPPHRGPPPSNSNGGARPAPAPAPGGGQGNGGGGGSRDHHQAPEPHGRR